MNTDTSPDAATVQRELIRRMPPSARLDLALDLSGEVIEMCKSAIRRRFPNATEEEVGIKFIELNYGPVLADAVRGHVTGLSVNVRS